MIANNYHERQLYNYILTVLSTEIVGFYHIPPYLSLEIWYAWNSKCFYLQVPNPLKYQTFDLTDPKWQQNLRDNS